MITNPITYLFTLALLATLLYLFETKTQLKLFRWIPAVVMIYGISMFLGSNGFFAHTQEIKQIYTTTKGNLLPAMLFLLLLQVDLRHFILLGKKLLSAYVLAVVSLIVSFVSVVALFDFPQNIKGAFGALAGSWMGGTANMIAVASALGVSESSLSYALIVDSINYTLWVMLLLFLIPFASVFNRFTQADEYIAQLNSVGCACTIGAKKYWVIVVLALGISLLSQTVAHHITLINTTTTTIITATLLGIMGSFTPLRYIAGTQEIATTMLYLIIALIGSQAIITDFSSMTTYVIAGGCILMLHAFFMLLGAKILKLDYFSIAVASLSNIGGAASAPLLAATYDKRLVGVGVLMAIIGYIIGTFGGLLVGTILLEYLP